MKVLLRDVQTLLIFTHSSLFAKVMKIAWRWLAHPDSAVGKALLEEPISTLLKHTEAFTDPSVRKWQPGIVDDCFGDAQAPEIIFWSPQRSRRPPQPGLTNVWDVSLCSSSPRPEAWRMERRQKLTTEKAHPKIGQGPSFSNICMCAYVCVCVYWARYHV